MSSIDNTHYLTERLAELLQHNRSMLKNAEAGEWDKVMEEEIKRREMLNAFYSSTDVQLVPGVVSATRKMLLLNQQIDELAESAKEEIKTEAVSINKGLRAVNAYTKHAL